jgi:hypothetical protein
MMYAMTMLSANAEQQTRSVGVRGSARQLRTLACAASGLLNALHQCTIERAYEPMRPEPYEFHRSCGRLARPVKVDAIAGHRHGAAACLYSHA